MGILDHSANIKEECLRFSFKIVQNSSCSILNLEENTYKLYWRRLADKQLNNIKSRKPKYFYYTIYNAVVILLLLLYYYFLHGDQNFIRARNETVAEVP